MMLAFRYRLDESNPDEVEFVRAPRGRIPAGLTQAEMACHSQPGKCKDLATRLMTGPDSEPFRHLMHKVFRCGWRFTQGDRRLDPVEYYIHVTTVRRTDTAEVLLDGEAMLTITDADKVEAMTRGQKAYRKLPIDVKVETYALVFGDSDGQQKQLVLLRKLRVGSDKDAICTLLESAFEAGMACARNLTSAADPASAVPTPAA